MSLSTVLQVLTSGLALGFIYCLVAIEYTLIWNSCGVINFAHEKFIMVGAYMFAGVMINVFHLDFVTGAIFMVLFMAIFGAVIAMAIINPMRNMPSGIFTVIGMLMLGYVLKEALRLIFGSYPFRVNNFLSGTVEFGGVILPKVYPTIVLVAVVLLLLQTWFFKYTKAGKAMRCVAQDKEAAAIMGINVKFNIALTVALSSVICGLIGMLVIPLYSVDLSMASSISLKGFASGVIGGFGTYLGALSGGLFVGISEAVYSIIGPAVYKDLVAFAIMIIFLLIKPAGIMGRSEKNKHKRNAKRAARLAAQAKEGVNK